MFYMSLVTLGVLFQEFNLVSHGRKSYFAFLWILVATLLVQAYQGNLKSSFIKRQV